MKSRSMERSPESKRKRAETYDPTASAARLSSAPPAARDGNDATLLEPLPATDNPDLYERTNHVQRFRRTRALFAQMEKQNMTTSGSGAHMRGRVASRSVSPGRNRSSGHFSPAHSPRPFAYDTAPRRHSPVTSPRARLPSDSSPSAHMFDYSSQSTSSYKNTPAVDPASPHHDSVTSPTYVSTSPAYRSYAAPYRKTDPKSHSESDLLRSSPSDVSEHSPKALTSPSHSGENNGASSKGATGVSVTSTLIPPWMQQRKAKVTSSSQLNRNNSSGDVTTPSVPQEAPASAPVTTTTDQSRTAASYVRPASYSRQSVRAGAAENAEEAHKKAREYIPKFKEDHDDDAEAIARMDSIFSWRSRRSREKQQQLDLEQQQAAEAMTSSTSGSLLPRRAPKEDIANSLQNADEYWKDETSHNGDVTFAGASHLRGHHGGHLLNDSVASSGSGEEMAHSESHDRIVLPGDSPSSPPPSSPSKASPFLQTSHTDRDSASVAHSSNTSWTSKYAIPTHASTKTTTSTNHDQPITAHDTTDTRVTSSRPLDDVKSPSVIHKTDTFERELSNHGRRHSSNDDAAARDDVMNVDDDVGVTHLDPEKDIDFEVPISSPSTASKPPPPFPEPAKPL